MDRFEYLHVQESVAERGPENAQAQAADAIHTRWIDLLNDRGAEGWELVSERFEGGKSGGLFFAAYNGTMKRPIEA